ncbi:MAG: DinB family protein [Candidatus Rokubacteria bacterium]|nr:DinB family protein [Candidatus Rokubacteria bacterium]
MITSVAEFVKYFDGVRRRTAVAVDRVGPLLAGFKPKSDEWTCAQIVRHLTGAEAFFVTKVVEDRFTTDLELGPAEAWAVSRARFDDVHRAQMTRLAALPDARLREKVADLDGGSVSAWRFLMAMVEHEVHHRSQLDAWLTLAGAEAPQIYGYRMEDVVAKVGAKAGAPS